MDKCIIITAYIEGDIADMIDIEDGDYVICADGGYDIAARAGIHPSIIIGDMDSANVHDTESELPEGIPRITVPSHKDTTDTDLCLQHALEKGLMQVLIIGGMGGRFDHSLANIQNMIGYTKKGMSLMMIDSRNIVMLLVNDSTVIPARENYKISLISHSEECRGVSISGVEYPLSDYTLRSDFPLGVSNEFTDDAAFVKVEKGELLIILSSDD